MFVRLFKYHLIFLLFYTVPCLATSTAIPPVIVTAKKTTRYSLSSAPETIITNQDISAAGATNLAQALQESGAIQLDDTTGNGSQVLLSMRGFGVNANSNTLLLINGIPITNPDLAPPDLNAIPLQEIAYIEIINGSESVLYGDQAVGGVINIVTRDDIKKRMEISCTVGSYDTHNCYAAINHQIKNSNFNISAMNNHTDNYRRHNNYDQTLLSGNLDYLYQSGKISFDSKIINERMLYPGALTAEQVAQDRRQAQNYIDFFKNWNGLFHLNDVNIILIKFSR